LPENGGVKNRQQECIAFGRRIRTLRSRRGFSQESFAEAADVHRTYIGGIERGERNPTLTTIYRIAEALNVRPSQLLK